jgi:NAD(P)-dependent dehydrogenase (short-subunit alcohol dehydrogenase family)
MPSHLPANPAVNAKYLKHTGSNRKLTARELRQRRSAMMFAKTFVPLIILAYVVSSLHQLSANASNYLFEDSVWEVQATDQCGRGRFDLADVAAVVTGANSGLGFETARTLTLLNAKAVILGCRTVSKCEATKVLLDAERESVCGKGESNVFVPSTPLDLDSVSAIDSWAAEVARSHSKLSHLVLNAGIMSTPLNPRNSDTNLEPQLHTNHQAHYHLTARLLPTLKSTAASGVIKPKIVSVSSLAAQAPFTYDSEDLNFEGERRHDSMIAYGQSKRANLLFAQGLHNRLHEKYGIASMAAHPGYSRTSLMTNGWYFLPEKLEFVKEWAAKNTAFSMSSYQGAQMSVRAAIDDSVVSGSYVNPMLYAVGVPVVSEGGRAVRFTPGYGEDRKSWPMLENAWSWFGMGHAFGEEEINKLFEFSEKISGLEIK